MAEKPVEIPENGGSLAEKDGDVLSPGFAAGETESGEITAPELPPKTAASPPPQSAEATPPDAQGQAGDVAAGSSDKIIDASGELNASENAALNGNKSPENGNEIPSPERAGRLGLHRLYYPKKQAGEEGANGTSVPRRLLGGIGVEAVVVTALFCAGILLASMMLVLCLRISSQNTAPVLGVAHFTGQTAAEGSGYDSTQIVAAALPSVVSIYLYEKGGITSVGSGSGIVLSANGYIATCAHVVHGAETLRVVLSSGKGYTATLVGMDPRHDLAVLKIRASGLSPAVFANSDELAVGQQVLAIGNAAGTLPGSPSLGILSGVGRELPISTVEDTVVRLSLLQTDAAINPGSSGGALVDEWGRVIGISIGKIEALDVENVGFAIPSNTALPILQSIMESGTPPAPPKLGVVVQELNETTGPAAGLPEKGLYIEEVLPESGLVGFGIEAGDVILEVDGVVMEAAKDLFDLLAEKKPGDTVRLKIYRAESGETIEVRAELIEN